MKSIIVSGNKNYGLGKHLYKKFPDASFYSRSCGGYHLTNHDQQTGFINKSLSYHTYISCSSLPDFHQLILVQRLWELWVECKKPGHIIVIGSTSELRSMSKYATEKRALKDWCMNFNRISVGNEPLVVKKSNGVKISHLSPGLLDTENNKKTESNKIDLDYFVDTIKWVMDQPEEIVINNLSVYPVQ
jgi:hypothetical protein